MHKILFHIGSLTVYSYGVMLAVGFIVATFVARYRFKEQYKNPDIVLDYVLAAVIGGVMGSRLFYVFGHWSDYKNNLGQIFKLNMDGLVFYGGLILGLILALLVGYLRHQKFWATLDLDGLCLPLALAFGRVGCLLNGCCYGKVSALPWAISYPVSSGIIGPRQPTQIYELVLDLALFGLLFWKRDSFKRAGMLFWFFCLGYGAIRFSMEFVRDHAGSPNAALTFQMMSLAMMVAAVIFLAFRYRLLPSATGDELA